MSFVSLDYKTDNMNFIVFDENHLNTNLDFYRQRLEDPDKFDFDKSKNIEVNQTKNKWKIEINEIMNSPFEGWDKEDIKDKRLKYLDPISKFYDRLCVNCPPVKRLVIPACSNCGASRLINKNTGDAVPIITYCMSQYCSDDACISHRKKFYRLSIGNMLLSQEESKIKKNTTKHVMLGFKRIPLSEFNNEFIKSCAANLHNFIKEWRKRNVNNYLKGVAVLDLAFNKKDNTIFVHYHLGVRPYSGIFNKDYLKELNELGKEYNLKVVFKRGKSSTNNLIDYLSKRRAGLFGHKEHNNNFVLKDLFDEEEFHNIFYKQKRFFSFGFSRNERKRINLQTKEIIQQSIEAGELFVDSLSSINGKQLLYFKPVCSCGCGDWRFVRYNVDGFDPPPVEILA